jgi:two-component system cell cycle response regulator DivK
MAKLLIVEDEEEIAELLADLLTDEGYELCFANNRVDAVATAIAELPDLVLADVRIPDTADGEVGLAGLDAMREIKSNPITAHIPVIAATASVMIQEKKRILETGCDDLAEKPFDFDALLTSIESHLSNEKPG